MNRSLGALGFLLFAAFASGCPMYSDNVLPAECIYATDCPVGYRCNPGGFCVAAPPHVGTGGDGGVTDASSDGQGGGDAPSDGASRDAETGAVDATRDTVSGDAADAGPLAFCGNPNDCASTETCGADGICHRGTCLMTACINQYQCSVTSAGPACVRADAKGCGADRQCLASERCIDGTCTATSELCSDRSQCGTGKACADGRCVATCTADGQCASGFLCRTALGICGAKATTCVHSADCGSQDQVCVDGACVPRCGAVGACGMGAGAGVCVDNGCVPSAKITSECDGQGTQGGCAAGNICLHRHCYVSCAQDAGGCNAQSSAPVCKMVTVANASYAVCGTTETLGTECDVTAGKACTDGKTCIDGFCR